MHSLLTSSCDLRFKSASSELSVLATKWNKRVARGPFDRFLAKSQGGDEVHALAEGIKRALDEFQVCVECNCLRCIEVDRYVSRLKDLLRASIKVFSQVNCVFPFNLEAH
jgi:hypothetical protein